jgi:hypothetical protein
MKQCKTCKFWEVDPYYPNIGICNLIRVHIWSYPSKEVIAQLKAVCAPAYLHCAENFGCVLWELNK